ncbi:helix-turn-helix domain-containing protein [Halobacterium zhouii]|uniref:helix-turn-helix domain-containing protein n=1 Tax=Halobacterium zhouii TaxID=2902624 RepID=UPI001E551B43|nr:helix-turn-helix domain-containing protein [Halobacterium zhouii]
MREVTLRIRQYGEPESDTSAAHPDVVVQSVTSVTGSARRRKRIVELTGPTENVRSFVRELGDDADVQNVKPLGDLDDSGAHVALTYPADWRGLVDRFRQFGVHFRGEFTMQAGWEHWTLYLDDGDDLGALVRSLEASGSEVDLVRDVRTDTVDGPEQFALGRMIDALTERQAEVLATAIAMGYYGPDSDTAIETVADSVGVASTTAWEHLARAERKVMTELGEHLAATGGRPVR